MIFLMRHGEDDLSRLGGWSDSGLSQMGAEQVKKTCETMEGNKYNIQYIFEKKLSIKRTLFAYREANNN